MSAIKELLDHLRYTGTPDKNRIIRVRRLAYELAESLNSPAIVKDVLREFNATYLALGFANMSDDPKMADRYRRRCVVLIKKLKNSQESGPKAA